MAIQTSRISTYLHLWSTPGVLPLWMKKCWPDPCSTFCSSGGSGAFQGPCGCFFQGWHHWSLCHQARPPAQRRPLRPRRAVQAPGWAVCHTLPDLPPVCSYSLWAVPEPRTGWGDSTQLLATPLQGPALHGLGVAPGGHPVTLSPLTPSLGIRSQHMALGGQVEFLVFSGFS